MKLLTRRARSGASLRPVTPSMRRLPRSAGAGASSQLVSPAEVSQSTKPVVPPPCRYRANSHMSNIAVPIVPATNPRAPRPRRLIRLTVTRTTHRRARDHPGCVPGGAGRSAGSSQCLDREANTNTDPTSWRVTVTLEPWGSGYLPLLERLMGDPRMTEHLGGPESADKLRERQDRYERLDGGD